MTLPTLMFDRLWHIGTLDPAAKGLGSLEGPCFSVSPCPSAWREISDGMVSGECYSADTSAIKFLDAHRLDQAMKDVILAWGVQQELAEAVDIWTVSYYDDEAEHHVYIHLDSKESAAAEASEILDLDEEDPCYKEMLSSAIAFSSGHKGTLLLQEKAFQNLPAIGSENVLDILLPLWVEDQTDLAGVWWEDDFSPETYSAPRGGILPSRLSVLEFTASPYEPYYPDEEGCEAA